MGGSLPSQFSTSLLSRDAFVQRCATIQHMVGLTATPLTGMDGRFAVQRTGYRIQWSQRSIDVRHKRPENKLVRLPRRVSQETTMSTDTVSVMTVEDIEGVPKAVVDRHIELFFELMRADIADSSVMNGVPNRASLALIPDDDPELAVYALQAG